MNGSGRCFSHSLATASDDSKRFFIMSQERTTCRQRASNSRSMRFERAKYLRLRGFFPMIERCDGAL